MKTPNQWYIIREVSNILSSGNLQVNDTKTEAITLKRCNSDTERCRKIKKLGFLLGDKGDIKKRKRLANKALKINKLDCIWLNIRNISIQNQRRVKLYNMLFKSTLLHNSSTLGMTAQDEQQLDSFHKKQLRRILKIRWPKRLEIKSCMKKPIQNLIRWNLLGHILRLHKGTPSRKAIKFMFEERSNKTF